MGRLLAWPMAVCALGCSTDKLPCTDSGDAWLTIPQSRVDAVAEIRVVGACNAIEPQGQCTPSSCVTGADGVQLRLISVHARSPGSCTLTVLFKDDCPSDTVDYTFGGALDNCCADACIRTAKTQAAAACAPTP